MTATAPPAPAAGTEAMRVCAWFLGARLGMRELERGEAVSLTPLTLPAGRRGYAVVFRFGAVALVGVEPGEERTVLARFEPHVIDAYPEPESEEAEVVIDPERAERVDASGVVTLREASVERLQVVATVLAKSAVLSHHEERIAAVFDRIENLADTMQRGARGPTKGRELLRQIGEVLLTQTRTVGRVEVTEKPEILWDHPELDRLYERLGVEYELRERDLALARKLDVIARTAETYLELLQNRQALRVEWYIVVLIAVEIVLILYDIFGRG